MFETARFFAFGEWAHLTRNMRKGQTRITPEASGGDIAHLNFDSVHPVGGFRGVGVLSGSVK